MTISSTEIIRSRTNPLISQVAALGADKKFRDKQSAFLVEGVKLVMEAIQFHGAVDKILICEEFFDKIDTSVQGSSLTEQLEKAQQKGTKILVIGKEAFEKISTERAPQGIVAVCLFDSVSHRRINSIEADHISPYNAKDGMIAMLESVRDPSNLGAILRCAAAFGFQRLILTGSCADLYNPKTLRASMGALFRLKTDTFLQMEEAVCQLKRSNRRILAARLDPDACVADRAGLYETDCLVIGNEGHGISEALSAQCDQSIYIPMSNEVESLNAATAAAVLMWEQLHACSK